MDKLYRMFKWIKLIKWIKKQRQKGFASFEVVTDSNTFIIKVAETESNNEIKEDNMLNIKYS